ncbi:MAG: peptidylprolyl isomerase [Pseudomonadota bacterium]
MLLKHTISAAFVSVFALTAPLQAENHASADTVVATVNGTDITLGHMIVLKQRLPAQYQQLPPNTLFEGILDQLVQQTILGEGNAELSVGSQAALENEERSLRAAEVIREIASDATTDEAVQAAYDAAYGNTEAEPEFNASHILVETEEEAVAIIEELDGGADFATLAQERSTGPSGPNGGQLGWFGQGAMVPPFEAAVVAMEAGTHSATPVQTQFGWHVIRLNEEREKAAPSIDQVRGQLVDGIQREAIEARVAELSEGAEVTRVTTEDIDPALLDDLSLLGE